MTSLKALFGGTFDPVHYGHLITLEILAQQIGLHQVTLLPNNIPPHRSQPEASAIQRVAMLELIVADNPLFKLDTRELAIKTPSWTIGTLEQLRREYGTKQPLAFIIGQDSLLSLHKWYHWEILLDLCHLIVCQRPYYNSKMLVPSLQRWLIQHQTHTISALYQQSAGLIWLAHTPMILISATTIRYRHHHNIPCDGLLPNIVINYINRNGLYHS